MINNSYFELFKGVVSADAFSHKNSTISSNSVVTVDSQIEFYEEVKVKDSIGDSKFSQTRVL